MLGIEVEKVQIEAEKSEIDISEQIVGVYLIPVLGENRSY
jgi:hypothetical protein